MVNLAAVVVVEIMAENVMAYVVGNVDSSSHVDAVHFTAAVVYSYSICMATVDIISTVS